MLWCIFKKAHLRSQLGMRGIHFHQSKSTSVSSPGVRGLSSKRQKRIKYGNDRKSKGEKSWETGKARNVPLLTLHPYFITSGSFSLWSLRGLLSQLKHFCNKMPNHPPYFSFCIPEINSSPLWDFAKIYILGKSTEQLLKRMFPLCFFSLLCLMCRYVKLPWIQNY